MAERRRIIPASVGPLFQPKEEKSWEPAVRFVLTLGEPNDTKCTEFSYRALYKNAVGETNDDTKFNELDEEDISGLAAFAKKFEEKYAAKGGKNQKRQREEFNDLMDAGMGYDDTDPFVDNSECYDELVPSALTTQLGGFYINQGQLNFREISGDEDDDDDDFIHVAKSRKKRTPHKKKRKTSFEEKERKKKKQEKKAKKQLQKQFGLKKKKNISGASPTVAELLKRQQLQDAASSNHKSTSNLDPSTGKLINGTSHSKDDADADFLDGIDPSLDLGLTDFKMDSDMAAVMEDALASLGSTDTLGGGGGGGSDENAINSSFKDDSPTPVDDSLYVKCPTNLPADMVTNVERIKQAARKSAEGKCKFFTPAVNQLLLKIELQSRNCSCGTRSQVYSHLACHLPCGKETLLKRAKKLRLGQDGVIKEPLQKLREAIAKVMPDNIQKFNEECQLHALEKANRMLTGKEEVKGSDDEEDKKSKQGNFGPRRKFQWTDHIRKVLCDVVNVKVKSVGTNLKGGPLVAEELVKTFLDTEVKPLWPQGWIQTRMLYKETRSVHGHITSNQPMKPKKIVLATKKVTTKKLVNNEGTPVSQQGTSISQQGTPASQHGSATIQGTSPGSRDISVASMIANAMMSPNASSNQSTPAITSPPERVPTLLDYANTPMGAPVQAKAPTILFKDSSSNSKQSTSPATTRISPVYKDSTKYAAASTSQGEMEMGGLTASLVEKLIADELAASDKKQTSSQVGQPVSQTIIQIRQPGSQAVSQAARPVVQNSGQIRHPVGQTIGQARQTVSQSGTQIRHTITTQKVGQTQQSLNQAKQTLNKTHPQAISNRQQLPNSGQLRQAAAATGHQPGAETRPMSIAEIVADTAKAMNTIAPSERQASSVLRQLSTHAQQNNTHHTIVTSSQVVVGAKPVVMKPSSSSATSSSSSLSSHERLKKLSLPAGKRTVVKIIKPTIDSGPNKTLAQTIQKLSSHIASSPAVAPSRTVQSVPRQIVSSVVVNRATTTPSVYSTTNIQKSQPVVRLTRPPSINTMAATSKPQVRMAATKLSTQPTINPTHRVVTSAQPTRTIMTKAARIAAEQAKSRAAIAGQMASSSSAAAIQVRHLTPATVQANMGNVFANLRADALFPSSSSVATSATASSKELPYYTTSATSGKNSIPKTTVPLSHSYQYQQQQLQQRKSPTIHASSYSPTKASNTATSAKHLSKSGSAFTAPSPPKQKLSTTPPALSPSTSPVGQKYPSYASQRGGSSPIQTSPTFPTAGGFNPAALATGIPGYQQLSMADLSPHKQQQAASGYAAAAAAAVAQGYAALNAAANQVQGSSPGGAAAALGSGSGDAIITGPAPGTFFHHHARTDQSPTKH